MDSNCPSFMATSEGKVIEFLVFSSASKYSSILDSSSMMGLILFTSETRFGEFFVILVVEFINSEHSGKKDISCISSLLDNAPNYLVGCVISYHLSKRKISQIRMKGFKTCDYTIRFFQFLPIFCPFSGVYSLFE